jgi:hypothetical protein
MLLIQAGCDACGVNLNGQSEPRRARLEAQGGPRFGGNFWWARCQWIRELRKPYSPFQEEDEGEEAAAAAAASRGACVRNGTAGADEREEEQEEEEEEGRVCLETRAKWDKARKAESELWLGSSPNFRCVPSC